MAWATVLGASSPLQGPGRKRGRRSWETTSPGKQVGSVPLGTMALSECPRRPLSGILHDVAEKLLPQERQLVGGGADGRVLELDRGEGCTTLWM